MSPTAKKRTRLVPRFSSVDVLVVPEFESWLADRSAHGLHFRKCAWGLLWFERGDKKAVRYRLNAISKLSPTPDGEKRTQTEEMGWHYVNKLGMFSVYASEEPDAPELHTDPVTQSYTMDEVAKFLRRNLIILAVLLAALAAMTVLFFLPYLTGERRTFASFVLKLVENSSLLTYPLIILLEFVCIGSVCFQSVYFLSLRRKLQAGMPVVHQVSYRGKTALNVAMIAFALAITCFSLYCTYRSITGYQRWNITAERPSPAAFALHQIEDDPQFRYTHLYPESRPEWDLDNRVSGRWTLLAPEQYEITQRGEIPGEVWTDDGSAYEPSMDMDYYRLIISVLAGPMLEGLIERDEADLILDGYARSELAVQGLDRAVLFTKADAVKTVLYVQSGAQVLRLRYYGAADLTQCLPELSAALS